MFMRRCQRIGIIAVLVAVICGANPVMALASDAEEQSSSLGTSVEEMPEAASDANSYVVVGAEKTVSDEKEEDAEKSGTDDIDMNDDAIWALIDRDELRSMVDVEALENSIDMEALEAQIDMEALAAMVDSEEHPIDIVNVLMPTIGNENPFSSMIDPHGLIYSLSQGSYGDIKVEKDALVLFKNHEGDYMFSSRSDARIIKNMSNVPIRLTIQAKVDDTGTINFVESRDKIEGTPCGMYLAVADKGQERMAVMSGSTAYMEVILDAAPDGCYEYDWNDETQTYSYRLKADFDESQFPAYSFWMTGNCNGELGWGGINRNPSYSVFWKASPISYEEYLESKDQVKVYRMYDEKEVAAEDASKEDATTEASGADEELVKDIPVEEELEDEQKAEKEEEKEKEEAAEKDVEKETGEEALKESEDEAEKEESADVADTSGATDKSETDGLNTVHKRPVLSSSDSEKATDEENEFTATEEGKSEDEVSKESDKEETGKEETGKEEGGANNSDNMTTIGGTSEPGSDNDDSGIKASIEDFARDNDTESYVAPEEKKYTELTRNERILLLKRRELVRLKEEELERLIEEEVDRLARERYIELALQMKKEKVHKENVAESSEAATEASEVDPDDGELQSFEEDIVIESLVIEEN